MTTPPENKAPDTSQEPADLSELTATDALLDRLGRRSPSDEDLIDPAVAVLAELVAVIDQSREPDAEAVRLIEVLDGRPLYISGVDAIADETVLMIDLTEREDDTGTAGAVEADDEASTSVNAGQGEPLVPITRLPSPSVIPIRVVAIEETGARRWDKALSHVGMPAASVVLLLAIGSGVSAAVTGNPMTPVNGITRVMAQLPGVQTSLEKVKTEISAAKQAAARRDGNAVALHLGRAKAGLGDVSASDRSELTEQIAIVENSIIPVTTPPVVPNGPGAAETPVGGAIDPEVGAPPQPSAGVPVPSPTPQPPTDPSPTPEAPQPSATQAPEPDPTTDPTDEPADPEPTPEVSETALAESTLAASTPSP